MPIRKLRFAATRDEIAQLEASLSASSVVDRETFFQNLDFTKREVRSQANALLKRLGIKVVLIKPERFGRANYSIYQQDKLLMKLTELDGQIHVSSYSPIVLFRLHSQKQIETHELESNVSWGREKYLSTLFAKPEAKIANQGNVPDSIGYDEPLA